MPPEACNPAPVYRQLDGRVALCAARRIVAAHAYEGVKKSDA
jgi:hypothetical protein